METTTPKSSNSTMWVILALVVVGLAVGAYLMMNKGSQYQGLIVPGGSTYSATLTPSTVTVVGGSTQQFTAACKNKGIVVDCNTIGTRTTIWTTTAGAITQSGLLTAQTAPATGLKVTAAIGGAVTATATVNVGASAPKVYEIRLIPGTPQSVSTNGALTLAAKCLDVVGVEFPACPTLAWTSDVGTVASTGANTARLSARSTVGAGTVKVSVDGQTATVAVTVTLAEPYVMDARLTPDPDYFTTNSTKDFSLSCSDYSGASIPCGTVEWSTDGGSFVSKDSKGARLTVQGQVENNQYVTVKIKELTRTVTFDVKQAEPYVANVYVTPPTALVMAGKTVQLYAICDDISGAQFACPSSLVWTATAGTVTQTGLYTAPNASTATGIPNKVKAAMTSGGSTANDSSSVEVTATVFEITVSPAPADIPVSTTKQFMVKCFDVMGGQLPSCPTSNLSFKTTAGSVSKSGVLVTQSQAADGKTLTVSIGTVVATATVNVKPANPLVMDFYLSPAPTSMYTSYAKQFIAHCSDFSGAEFPCPATVWNTDVGTISSNGYLVAQDAPGTGKVTAVISGMTREAAVTVKVKTQYDHGDEYLN